MEHLLSQPNYIDNVNGGSQVDDSITYRWMSPMLTGNRRSTVPI